LETPIERLSLRPGRRGVLWGGDSHAGGNGASPTEAELGWPEDLTEAELGWPEDLTEAELGWPEDLTEAELGRAEDLTEAELGLGPG
jgi:hypothetical protein